MKSESKKNHMVLFIGQTEEFNVIWRSIASLKTAAMQESQHRRENASRRKIMENYGTSKLSRLVVRETVFNRGVFSNERDIKMPMTMYASRAKHAR